MAELSKAPSSEKACVVDRSEDRALAVFDTVLGETKGNPTIVHLTQIIFKKGQLDGR